VALSSTHQLSSACLALAAQCLSSIATLLHDTFLPLYMSEVLGMSNTTVRPAAAAAAAVAAQQ
jgi:hypothetical protein